MRSALVLLAFGLVVRLLFWLATGDRFEPFAAVFQGDAPVWQQLAYKADHDLDDELFRLPLRPPGMHWLVAALWNGSSETAWTVRSLFVVLGALVAPLVYLLIRRHLSQSVAVAAGGLCAVASSLLALGSGPHSELPYLVLVLVTLFDQERLRTAPTGWVAVRWGALHGVICLLRAEHALTFVAFLAVLAWQRAPRWRRSAAWSLAACVAALVPWHVTAYGLVEDYNTIGAPRLPAAGQVLPGALPWAAEALERLDELPAFQRGPVFQFVTDTVRARGRARVIADDLAIVGEAYGTWPEPLSPTFVCLYGGLNFFLANTPEAAGGFSAAALDRPPPLQGGPSRYPPGLLQVLPRAGSLTLSYPPHLGRLQHGYRDGWNEIAADPGAAAGRVAQKLWHAAEGAASGLGGYGLPIGLSGPRRSVDIVTAEGAWPAIYRVSLIAFAIFGLWSLRRAAWLLPWLAFALTKLVIVAVFFGYARQGALCAPVVMLGVAFALERLAALRPRVLWIALALLLGLETVRTFTTELTIALPDGTPAVDLSPNDHRPVRVGYR